MSFENGNKCSVVASYKEYIYKHKHVFFFMQVVCECTIFHVDKKMFDIQLFQSKR